MCEAIIEGSVSISDSVDVDVNGLEKALREHNELTRHQNTILSGILDELVLIRREKL